MAPLAVLAFLAVWAVWSGLGPIGPDSPPSADSAHAAQPSAATAAPASNGQADAAPADQSSDGPAAAVAAAAAGAVPFHIGLVHGALLPGSDVSAGVEEAVRRYGLAGGGGLIRPLPLDPALSADPAALAAAVAALADDPLMRVLVVGEGLPGTLEAAAEIRRRRPEMIILVGESHESLADLAAVADLVVMADFVARGYLIPYSALRLGARTLVHVSFPRHKAMEALSRQLSVMEAACRELGLALIEVEGPDPLAGATPEEIGAFYGREIPRWLDLYGPGTAFFSTNNAHAAAIISNVALHGGVFVEAQDASPLTGYPEALSLDVAHLAGDWPGLLRALEARLSGAKGLLGTWTSSLSFGHVTALVEFGRLMALGRAEASNLVLLLECYDKYTSGVQWNGARPLGPDLRPAANVALVYQDTYVFGRGYVGTTAETVPPRYRLLDARHGRPEGAPAPSYRVAVVAAGQELGGDGAFGAAELIARHGDAADGGMIVHAAYGPDLVDDAGAMARLIENLAADPLVRVIVVGQAAPGTAEGFRRVKAARPDVLCLAAEPHEPPAAIAARADLVLAGDDVARGYLIPWTAKRLGARTLVHLSFERHLGIQRGAHRREVMRAACAELGLEFVDAEAADTIDSPGSAGDDVAKIFSRLIAAHGPETAIYSTADVHVRPLVEAIARTGQGLMPEGDLPSVLVGFPEALGVEISTDPIDWDRSLRKIELAAEATKGSGRLGVWPYPLGYSQTAALAEYGMRVVEDRALKANLADILECLRLFTPGVNWNASTLSDPVTGAPLRNFVVAYEDTYILGLGNIRTTEVEIPLSYYSIGLGDDPVDP
jgi:DNA-binding LacI/PurR family transcriptional regulator